MTQLSAIANAVIMLPVGAAIDGLHARQCINHIERRGYALVAVLNDWASALKMIRANEAEIVVFARREHFRPDFTPRIEFVGQTTRDIRPDLTTGADDDGTGRHRSGRRPRLL